MFDFVPLSNFCTTLIIHRKNMFFGNNNNNNNLFAPNNASKVHIL